MKEKKIQNSDKLPNQLFAHLLQSYKALLLLARKSHNLSSLTAWATVYKIIKKNYKFPVC